MTDRELAQQCWMSLWRDEGTEEADFRHLCLAHIVSAYEAASVVRRNSMLCEQSAKSEAEP